MIELSGRTALVTGGNRGIGLEVCRLLAELGADVLLGARDTAAGERAAQELGLVNVSVAPVDVADSSSVRALGEQLGGRGIDVLVNNAGIYPREADLRRDPSLVEAAWQVNTLGAWRTTRTFIGHMVERGWGRVVNVSTGLAENAHERGSGGIYRETKIALNAMTRALAEDLEGTRVLVNAISPGWCRTDMGGSGAGRSAADGAASIVWGVTLGDDGPSGGYFYDGAPLHW
jgi:NAD(P)-dependent dehydrogenase (short-subunit alcohol dehydrogenase family)